MILLNQDFNDFTYSKLSHFKLFKDFFYEYSFSSAYKNVNPDYCRLKVYQDLLIMAFIASHVPKGARILEIGGGDSRVISYFKSLYSFYNIDKLEGLGAGPTDINPESFILVQDYMGNFNQALEENSFDFVFSISALEHVPSNDPGLFLNIFEDIQRVLKPGGYSLHAFDVVINNKGSRVWSNPFLFYLFENSNPINSFIQFDAMLKDSDVFTLSEKYYNDYWKSITQKTYQEFGKPLSYNILWRK
jgi:SAM-dependent methyltransferase